MEITWPSKISRSARAIYTAQLAAAEVFAGNFLVGAEGQSRSQWAGALPEAAVAVVYAGFAAGYENGSRQDSEIHQVEQFEHMKRRGPTK